MCLDASNATLVGQTIAPGGSLSCTFQVTVSGNGNDSETDLATVKAVDDDVVPNEVSDSDDATVTITPVDPAASLIKIAQSAIVTYKVTINNDSTASSDPLTVQALSDDVYGDLLDAANPNVSNNTCASLAGAVIPAGESQTCTFNAVVTSNAAGEASVTDTVTGMLDDDEGSFVNPDPSDTAKVILTQ